MGTSLSFRARLATLSTTRSLQGTPSFFTINIHPEICESSATGQGNIVATFENVNHFTGLACDPDSGILYASESIPPGNSQVYSIDPANLGEGATRIGSTGFGEVEGLAFDYVIAERVVCPKMKAGQNCRIGEPLDKEYEPDY